MYALFALLLFAVGMMPEILLLLTISCLTVSSCSSFVHCVLWFSGLVNNSHVM